MSEELVSLALKKGRKGFLASMLTVRCKWCGKKDGVSYYDILASRSFKLLKPKTVFSPFIAEQVFDEALTMTPLLVVHRCTGCGRAMEVEFPLSREALLGILKSRPPDPVMYG